MLLALPSPAVLAADWIYTVIDGDNLWNLSEKYLDSPSRFEQVRRLNGIEFPRRMPAGTRLRVPMKWIRSNPVPARIAAVHGRVELTHAGGQQQDAAVPGTLLQLGDTLATGADSSAAVEFADGSVVTLHGASEMRFDHLSAHGETGMVDSRLHLIDGRLDTRVQPAVGPGSRFQIETPSAISAVRGTNYRAAVTKGGQASNIEVLEGKVKVTGARTPRLVEQGFGTQIAVGKAPTAPRRLLPAPVLDALPERIRELNWPLVWQELAAARGYRVEIAADPDLQVILWEQVVDRARLPLPDLADGDYRVRVRGIDSLGLEGNSSVRALVIDTRPQPPIALQPADGQVLRGTPAQLRWTASADADHYLLEIARGADFADPVVRQTGLRATRYDSSEIDQPGTYHWRLTSITAAGEPGPAGAARSWQLKPVPAAIDAELVATDDSLVASWRPGHPAQTYQVQVARDAGFADLEIERTIEQPRIGLDQVSGQVRYLRVRAIEPDGYEGPWGAVQRIDPPPDPSAWLIPALGVLGILLL